MTIAPRFVRRVAGLLRQKPEDIDVAQLRSAVYHVEHKTQEYWDMMANTDQLDGNPPPISLVAAMYADG